MKKVAKFVIIIITLAILICYGATTSLAAEETQIDYEALFARADEVDGYQAEAYFLEVNNAFDNAPEKFVEALSKQPYDKINHLSFNIAIEHRQEADSYKSVLNTMLDAAAPDKEQYETLILMQIGILRSEAGRNVDPDAFETEFHNDVKKYYREHRQLFFLSLCNNGPQVYDDFADALIYHQNADEVNTLRNQLDSDAIEQWATDDIREVIDTLLAQINNKLTPPVTESDPTVPTVTEEPKQTGNSPAEGPRGAEDPSENDWAVALIVVTLVTLISCAIFFLIRKMKRA